MNLNKVFVLGNVTRDPEAKALPSGQQVVNFGIATNRFYTDAANQKQQDVEFHNIVAFGKLADTISRYVTKGSLILIEGRIKTRSWNNAQGVKQYKTEIITEGLQLGPRSQGASGSPRPYQAQQASQQPQATDEIPVIQENYAPPASDPMPDSFNQPGPEEIDVKDIPF
jgi:single-strand DNA-binding protein